MSSLSSWPKRWLSDMWSGVANPAARQSCTCNRRKQQRTVMVVDKLSLTAATALVTVNDHDLILGQNAKFASIAS